MCHSFKVFKVVTVLATVIYFTTACTAQYVAQVSDEVLEQVHLKSQYRVERQSSWVVHSDTSIFLGQPEDLQSKRRHRHLTALHNALDYSLRQRFPDYATDNRSLSLHEAFIYAELRESTLLFWPKLAVSENNINSTQELAEGSALHSSSGKLAPDKLAFQVLIYEVRTRRLMDIATVFSSSHFFANNDKALPSSLFNKAAGHYLQSITGRASAI